MSTLQIELDDRQKSMLDSVAAERGVTPKEVVQDALTKLLTENADEAKKFAEWRDAMLKVEGIWEDRDDLPDFGGLRQSMDRNVWER